MIRQLDTRCVSIFSFFFDYLSEFCLYLCFSSSWFIHQRRTPLTSQVFLQFGLRFEKKHLKNIPKKTDSLSHNTKERRRFW